MLHSAGSTKGLWEMEWLHSQTTFFFKDLPHFFLSCSPSLHPRSSSHSAPYLPTSLFPLSPISVSVTLARSLPTSLSLSRSCKVKPPRRLMDENGIKMKAHFQIMKICSRRLGSLGGCWGADQINIEIYVCLARAQTIPMCYFQQGAKVENITKILIVFEKGNGKAGPLLFQPAVWFCLT